MCSDQPGYYNKRLRRSKTIDNYLDNYIKSASDASYDGNYKNELERHRSVNPNQIMKSELAGKLLLFDGDNINGRGPPIMSNTDSYFLNSDLFKTGSFNDFKKFYSTGNPGNYNEGYISSQYRNPHMLYNDDIDEEQNVNIKRKKSHNFIYPINDRTKEIINRERIDNFEKEDEIEREKKEMEKLKLNNMMFYKKKSEQMKNQKNEINIDEQL